MERQSGAIQQIFNLQSSIFNRFELVCDLIIVILIIPSFYINLVEFQNFSHFSLL